MEGEESKLLHFVNRKTPFCKVPGKEPLEIQEPLEIPWPHPTAHKPTGPQTKISWLNTQELVVYLDNRDQSRTNTQPFERKWPIRRSPTYKSFFFPHIYSLYKQCNQKPGAPPSRSVGIGGRPSSSLVIKTLLLLHGISAPWWSLGDFATWA